MQKRSILLRFLYEKPEARHKKAIPYSCKIAVYEETQPS